MQKSAVQLKIEAQLQASVDLLKQAKRYVGQSTTIGGQDLSREITEFVATVDRNPAETKVYGGGKRLQEHCLGPLAVEQYAPLVCRACGQADTGQMGEYPCAQCGVPTTHDPQS